MSSKNILQKLELRLLGADCVGELDYLVDTDPGPAPGHPGHDGHQHPAPVHLYSQHKPVLMQLHTSPVHSGGGAETGVLQHSLAEGAEREGGDPGLVPQLGDGHGRVAEARHHRAEGGHQVVFVQSLEQQWDQHLGYRRG